MYTVKLCFDCCFVEYLPWRTQFFIKIFTTDDIVKPIWLLLLHLDGKGNGWKLHLVSMSGWYLCKRKEEEKC